MATTALNSLTLPHSGAPRRIAHRLKGRPRQLSRVVNNAAKAESVRGDEKGKLLVLGGTGFIGSKICERALSSGYDVVSISWRGDPPGDPHRYPSDIMQRVDWRKGDCTREDTIAAVLQEGGFVGCIHAVGMLLASDINALASGSGSKPTPGATYDDVTRITAFNAANAAADLCVAKNENDAVPFVFVSAAEARWDFKAPVAWLEEYLVEAGAIRGSCLRPSLVYSPDKPAAMPAVGAFYVGNAIGLPFVDRPVTVDTLASAAVRCVEDGRSSGALDYRDMERLSAELRRD